MARLAPRFSANRTVREHTDEHVFEIQVLLNQADFAARLYLELFALLHCSLLISVLESSNARLDSAP